MAALGFALKHWRLISFGLIVSTLLTMTGCARRDAVKWREKWETLDRQAGAVLVTIREVAGNPGLRWRDAGTQVQAIGNARDAWAEKARLQSAKIAEMGREPERLKALSVEAQRVAKRLIAKREGAIARLDTAALSPGDRDDCARQMRLAEKALDAVYAEGL